MQLVAIVLSFAPTLIMNALVQDLETEQGTLSTCVGVLLLALSPPHCDSVALTCVMLAM